MPERFTRSTEVQSLVFSKEYFTRAQAKEWAEKHGFKYGKVDETDNTYRLRQTDPDNYDKDTFRYKTFKQGIRAVVAMPLENPSKDFVIAIEDEVMSEYMHEDPLQKFDGDEELRDDTISTLVEADATEDQIHRVFSIISEGYSPVKAIRIAGIKVKNPRNDEGWTAELFLMIAHEDNEVYLDSVVLGGRRGKWKTPRGQKIVGFGDKQVMRVSFARAHGDTKEEAEEHLLKFQPRWIIDVISD